MTEITYISVFDVKLNGTIEIRKTTDFLQNEEVKASSYWRTTLLVNDPNADEVLGTGGYYRTLANDAWSMIPEGPTGSNMI
jgi:hypothetical protein